MRSEFTIYDTTTGIPLKTGYSDIELLEVPEGHDVFLERINLDSQKIDVATLQVVDREADNG